MRLLLKAKLPLPSSQYKIRGEGRFLARVDFAYPDARLAIEVDGYRWHSGRQRWQRDLARRNVLTTLGWRVIHMTSTDLDERSGEIVALVAGALRHKVVR